MRSLTVLVCGTAASRSSPSHDNCRTILATDPMHRRASPADAPAASPPALIVSARGKANRAGICCVAMVEPASARHPEAPEPDPQGRCVCGEKVTIADAREVTLPNGRAGWQGYCPECGAPLREGRPLEGNRPHASPARFCASLAFFFFFFFFFVGWLGGVVGCVCGAVLLLGDVMDVVGGGSVSVWR